MRGQALCLQLSSRLSGGGGQVSTSSTPPSLSFSPASPLGASPGQQREKEPKRTMCPGHQDLGNRTGNEDRWNFKPTAVHLSSPNLPSPCTDNYQAL